MADVTIYGKVGHKLAKASSGAVLANCVDTEPKHGLLERCIFTDGQAVYAAIYVLAGQTLSGSAIVMVDASGTASVTASGYIALMSAGLQALPGECIWVRSTAMPNHVTL